MFEAAKKGPEFPGPFHCLIDSANVILWLPLGFLRAVHRLG